MRAQALAASLLLLVLSGPVLAQEGWTRFELEEAGFSVLMPGHPTYEQRVDDTIVGTLTTHSYSVRNEHGNYAVARTSMPPAAFLLGNDVIFRRARDEALKTVQGEAEDYGGTRLQGYEARRLRYRIPEGPKGPERVGKAWFVLVGDSLWILNANLPTGQGSASIERFHNSVVLPAKE